MCPPERAPLFRTDTCALRIDPELRGKSSFGGATGRPPPVRRARAPGSPLERRKKKTASARGLNKSLKNLELKLSERCRYCFGGVVAGGLVAGAGGLVAGAAGLLAGAASRAH